MLPLSALIDTRGEVEPSEPTRSDASTFWSCVPVTFDYGSAGSTLHGTEQCFTAGSLHERSGMLDLRHLPKPGAN